MILTLIYLGVCLISGSIYVDYTILTATVILDIIWMTLGFVSGFIKGHRNRVKK